MIEKTSKFKQTEIGKIPEDWDVIELREVLQKKGYIRGPFGSALRRPELKSEGIPVYEQANAIYDHREFRFFVDKDKYEELKRFTVKENDLIISCSGTFGKVSIISKEDPKGIISQALLILRPDTNKINPYFLKYFFSSKKGYESIASRSTGSVQVNIAKRDIIEKIPLGLPDINEQKAIACILSSLDDKIELNQRMNKTLEGIAQAIFKHWFVDFEFPNEEGKPYKSSGGEMVYNEELGKEIPKEWTVGKLGDIIKITSGKRPEEKTDEEDDVFNIPLVGSSKIMGFVKEPLFREPVIIIGRVGTHGIVQRFNIPTFPSDNTLVMTSPFYEYVYQILKRIDYESLNIGSTQPLITQTSIKNYRLIIPNENILMLFEQKSSILFERIYQNKKE